MPYFAPKLNIYAKVLPRTYRDGVILKWLKTLILRGFQPLFISGDNQMTTYETNRRLVSGALAVEIANVLGSSTIIF